MTSRKYTKRTLSWSATLDKKLPVRRSKFWLICNYCNDEIKFYLIDQQMVPSPQPLFKSSTYHIAGNVIIAFI